MVSDDVLRAMCRALVESSRPTEGKWLSAIIGELIERKLLHPKTSHEERADLARAFAIEMLRDPDGAGGPPR